ncbi:MAG TPA: phosphomethylpyrimidine synthase [Elusimicrobia bacterium]|nr:MAG: phosphomethylpyrimidine synthase [Elusimicrobia bacterium RIFOXYA12_FULL_49_49]OGS10938.1 MAG: phosphomethylpyrimidine synthase [Elusimicrobia bacterium RIFOXYB1_FULL_48_9]OGS16627.1 MAG: phosphomethylpyrimidine synthase [Elusimicrobia bacterium RIFOXYA2_FULL_47_53]OGS25476.1 MAG: phosphomethylpyrimidine synthase [Elusimicrobia bacterium RIFOXYB12_FULL_50_12]OGS31605.1 MAG: phosphomethylpyrimidine synthase [Elusimicrobia bacterium RIFOXYB2_FULL_46_23]HBU69052.1 phosphomethylpyrimidine 
MTIVDSAKKKIITPEMELIASKEKVPVDFILTGLADGTIVIPKNATRSLKKLAAVGAGLCTKVNANIGTSPDHISVEEEREKLKSAVDAGADAVMDLSTGGDIRGIRKMILADSPIPVGTVPIYQTACETVMGGKEMTAMAPEHLFATIEEQAQEGVDFMTVHCGINRETVGVLNRHKRLVGVVSRGGSFLVRWITATGRENPLFENYDKLLEIAKKYDVTLSLGDGLRPGCLADASDAAQIAELSILGELVLRARQAGVQVMIEGPGHVPLNQIEANVLLAKRLAHNAPIYLLGPLVTDIAAGYDHITGAIGGAIAASAGADFLCYVTPAEHLSLPSVDDVYQGVIASRIAGHAADIVKNVPGARERDNEFSKFRKKLDWDAQAGLALDPVRFKAVRSGIKTNEDGVCTMCGQFCAMKD